MYLSLKQTSISLHSTSIRTKASVTFQELQLDLRLLQNAVLYLASLHHHRSFENSLSQFVGSMKHFLPKEMFVKEEYLTILPSVCNRVCLIKYSKGKFDNSAAQLLATNYLSNVNWDHWRFRIIKFCCEPKHKVQPGFSEEI